MADRYKDRPFPADDRYVRGGPQAPSRGEADPLAELARLIGQTDPFAGLGGRANQPVPPRPAERDAFREPEPALESDDPPAGPPSWMQRVASHEPHEPPPPQDFDEPGVHPVQRYGAAHPEEADYPPLPQDRLHQDPRQQDPRQPADLGRYDDALYGQAPGGHDDLAQQEQGYDDPYYQDDYDSGHDEPIEKPRRGGMITVAVVVALAVVGTGAAFAYRSYFGTPRSGEPPIIRADAGPNKMIPPSQSGDISGKLIQDRVSGGSPERLVSREEQPVDVNDPKSGPRVIFPPLNQNANPPSSASVAPGNRPPPSSGTISGDEPHKIRTVPVRGDQPDPANAAPPPGAPVKPATPPPTRSVVAAPVPRTPSPAAANANASTNAPLSLNPAATAPAEPRSRVASTNTAAPQPIAPATAGGAGNFMVQVSSQRNENDAQSSYKSIQGKFPAVLGSREPLIRRADLGEKGIYYRAMVGPFTSRDEAAQFCETLKTAGGQCIVPRN
jgi:hypothetical protein